MTTTQQTPALVAQLEESGWSVELLDESEHPNLWEAHKTLSDGSLGVCTGSNPDSDELEVTTLTTTDPQPNASGVGLDWDDLLHNKATVTHGRTTEQALEQALALS